MREEARPWPPHEVLSSRKDWVHPLVQPDIPETVERALAAGATPPLEYMGAGMYGVVLCDAKQLAFKVFRILPRVIGGPRAANWAEYAHENPSLRQTVVDEAEWLAAANESPTLAPHVPRFMAWDDEQGVLVRECMTGKPGGWNEESSLHKMHRSLDKAAMTEIGWTMPEFKGDAWVQDERDGQWKLVDTGWAQRVGRNLLRHVVDHIEGRIPPYARLDDLAFYVRRESGPRLGTIDPEEAAPVLERLYAAGATRPG